MVGIRRLAEHLDLSVWTVSRALNGKRDVSEATRRRVLDAAQALGYEPNYSGISLKTGRTGLVGFLMRTGADIPVEGNMFFMGVIDGVQSVLSTNGLDLVALLYPPDGNPDLFLRRVVARKFVDALIVTGFRKRDSRLQFLLERKIPFVSLGRSESSIDYLWFDADIDVMAKQAAERLIAAGHRRFGVFSSNDGENFNDVFVDRFKQELAARELPTDSLISSEGPPNEGGGYALTMELLAGATRPSAIVLLNEAMALGVYRALQEHGLAPGRDIALIGRDSPQTRFLYPALTRFRLPLRDVGVELAHGLLSVMPKAASEGEPRSLRRLWQAELIVGESDGLIPRPSTLSEPPQQPGHLACPRPGSCGAL